MNLQQAVLNRYQTVFPDDSLRMISSKTQIQLTRVFRLMNGSEMKLREYEAFNNVIINEGKSTETDSYLNLSRKCLSKLPESKLKQLERQMLYALKLNKQTKQTITYSCNELGA